MSSFSPGPHSTSRRTSFKHEPRLSGPRARARCLTPVVLVGGLLTAGLTTQPAGAQEPVEGEVRQLVTFSFLPGRTSAALDLYQNEVLPLYQANTAMRSFRAFREVESPVPMSLMVVSSFLGMEGMDHSNEALRAIAADAGTSIGSLYGQIGAESSGHTDQFVVMLPYLGQGDPSDTRLTLFEWIRLTPGSGPAFEGTLRTSVLRYEEANGVPASTGRFILSDGWDYLRILGFESLGDYQAYRDGLDASGWSRSAAALIAERRQIIVANIPDLAVR